MLELARPFGRKALERVALFLFSAALAAPAAAHDPGLSSLDVSLTSSSVHVRLALSPRDAALAARLDDDRRLTADDWRAAAPRLAEFAREAIEVRIADRPLAATIGDIGLEDEATVFVNLSFALPGRDAHAVLASRVPMRLAAGHRQLLTVRAATGVVQTERVLAARDIGDPIALDIDSGQLARAHGFFMLGLEHILSGYDHLLFLAGLLLGVHRLRDVVTTASAFTIGHSITLACAATGLVSMTPDIVEPLIAASIVYVGVENFATSRTGARWQTALPFGLVHGFGFAGALQDLSVGGGSATVVPLGFFNLGVEAGQAAVALILWPALVWVRARTSQMPRRIIPRACSGLVATCGAYWFVVRVG